MLRVLSAVLLLVAGCGGGGASPAPSAGWVDPDGPAPVIGSLTVDPADGSLLLASNTGLFRIGPDGGRPSRVTGTLRTPSGSGSISAELVVRFDGDGRLLGSGHPSGGSDLPAALGLIASDDGGRTWRSVSKLGEADLHALAFSGDELAAAIFGQAQILVSRDGGRTFTPRIGPLPLVDLALDPSDARRWVASSEQGVFVSADDGRTWRQYDPTPNSRLAWGARELFRVDPGGPVLVSRDGGRTWKRRGDTGGEPQALAVGGGGELFVAMVDGTVRRSGDGGRTWVDFVSSSASSRGA